MQLEAIAAVYADWGIGKDGTQSLVIPADRKRFRTLTGGAAIIVGRKTLADFPGGKPLPGRTNIVLTSRAVEIEGAIVVHSVRAALEAAEAFPKVFVVGGESVYREFLDYCTKLHLTRIDARPESDKFFPNLEELPGWTLTQKTPEHTHNGVNYDFREYTPNV
ncbi:MAG: dihydrofolate reductase [Oscillospiraceae bacterium]|jgi:dihydrofolate reductase|nr:dihydrofolate reductase [Oscillospiraceae bacterium]